MSTLTRLVMGSPPLPMRRSCASTAAFTLTILAYVSLVFFGLTAKQSLLSTYACLRQSVAATKLADLEGDWQEFTQQGPMFLKYIIKEANIDTTSAAISVSMNMIELDETMNSLQHDVKSFNVHCQGHP